MELYHKYYIPIFSVWQDFYEFSKNAETVFGLKSFKVVPKVTVKQLQTDSFMNNRLQTCLN